ncbi:MAG: hypothetical protein SGI86_22890 [Deltaproteobacteria bacterium]|nr:hypothetical protein [Deltaproteobacteria bacterium]
MSILRGVPVHEPTDSIADIERLSSDPSALVSAAVALEATSPDRAAQTFFNAGFVARDLGNEALFIECCRRALTADSSFRPAIWALRDLARQKGQWQELAELLRHEFRLGRFGDDSDRAAILTELAWVELERLDDAETARNTLESAFELAPNLPATALSLLVFPTSTEKPLSGPSVLRAHLALAEQSHGAVRAAWMMSLGWRIPLQDREIVDQVLSRMLATLKEPDIKHDDARSLDAAIDRLSRRSFASDGDVARRLGVLDALEERRPLTSTPATAAFLATRVATLREKARLLRVLDQKDAAASALLRAHQLVGQHPLLREDLRELAHAGAESLATDAHFKALFSGESTEIALARAETARRNGANGEAMAEINAVAADDPLAFLAFLQKLQLLVDLNDPGGIADAFEQEARRRERDPLGRSTEEAVHFWVRAGTIYETALGKPAAAERCYLAALAIQKDYRPASEGLLSVLSGQARWDDLVEYLSLQMAQSDDPNYTRAVGSGLLTLNRDVLHDAGAALLSAQRLARLDVNAGSLFRLIEVAVRASGHDREAFETAVAALQALHDRIPQPAVRAALDLVGARLCRRMGEFDRERSLLERALRLDPGGGAAALIETSPRITPGEKLRALQSELAAVEMEKAVDRSRALRFRIAFTALSDGKSIASLQILEPLALAGDRAASAWMLDIARREGSARALRLACGTADSETTDKKSGPASSRALALGEALERAGNRAEARAAFARAAALADSPAQRISSELGRARLAMGDGLPANRTDPVALAEAIDGMAAVQEGEAGKNLNDLARICRLLSGQAEEAVDNGSEAIEVVIDDAEASTSGREAGLEWLRLGRCVTKPDVGPKERLQARARAMTALIERNTAQAEVTPPFVAWRLNLLKAILNTTGVERDMALDGAQGELLASDLLDLGGRQAQSAYRSRLQRLAFSETHGDRQLAYALAIEYGLDAETHGNRLLATDAYRMALVHEPGSLSALSGLARTSEQLGLPAVAARSLFQLAQQLKTPESRRKTLTRAAELFEIAGEDKHAASTFAMVLAESPGDARIRLAMGSVLRKRNQTSGDATAFSAYLGDEISQLAVAGPAAHTALLANYLERATLRSEHLNDAQGAISDLKNALELAPDCLTALLKLGELALLDGNGAAAQRFLENAARIVNDANSASPVEQAALQCQISQALFLQERWLDAIMVLLVVLRNHPGHDLALKRLLELVTRHPEREFAIRTLQAALFQTGMGSLSLRDRTTLLLGIADASLGVDENPNRATRFALRALEVDPMGDAGGWLEHTAARLGTAFILETDDLILIDRIERSLLARFAPWLAAALFNARTAIATDWLEFETEASTPELLIRTAMLSRLRGNLRRATAASQLSELFSGVPLQGSVPHSVDLLGDSELIAFADVVDSETRNLLSVLIRDGQVMASSVLRAKRKQTDKLTRAFATDDVRVTWIRGLAEAIGLDDVIVNAAPEDSDRLRGDFTSVPVLWVPSFILPSTPANRFWVMQALIALRFGLPDGLDSDDLMVGLAARARVAELQASIEVPRSILSDLKKRIAKPDRGLDVEVARTISNVSQRAAAIAVATVARIARFVALNASGDLGRAVVELARTQSGGNRALPLDSMLDLPQVRELVIHAFSPAKQQGSP